MEGQESVYISWSMGISDWVLGKKINGGIDQTPVARRLRKSVARGIRDPGHGPEQSDL